MALLADMNKRREATQPTKPRRVNFSLYDLTDATPPSEPTEDLNDFIKRISAVVSRPQPAVSRPVSRPSPSVVRKVIQPQPLESVSTPSAIAIVQKALKQERALSESLTARVSELEVIVDQALRVPEPTPSSKPPPLPLPVRSTSSEWRLRLEEVQKRQLEKLVGRGGINITI